MKTPIQSLLFRAGISQAKVAAQLGIDAKTASQKLTGRRISGGGKLWPFGDLLGIENPRRSSQMERAGHRASLNR